MRSRTIVVTIPGDNGEDGIVVASDVQWSPELADVVSDAAGRSLTVACGDDRTRGPDVVHVLLAVGEWAGTSAAWDATKKVARVLAGRTTDAAVVSVIVEREAINLARWVVAERYGEHMSGLMVMASGVDVDGVDVVLSADSGWEYTCRLKEHSSGIRAVRLRRSHSM